jgi:RimJ/RimL family protein N-acetyltransferase
VRIRGAKAQRPAIERIEVVGAKRQRRGARPVGRGNGMSAKNVAVQRLTEGSRPELSRHFLSLDREDVRLRFGVVIPEAAIAAYVERIDFDTDAVFGVYDEELVLAAVAHVAFSGDMAELGVSVLPAHRGRGLGSALLARAAEHVRNRFVTRLFMYCLAENAAMMHIARKLGMKICIDTGEADAFLKLAPADPASVTGEFVEQRLALFDYALKSQAMRIKELNAPARPPED